MNNYCLTMWAEEPIRCSGCGKDIGWERVSIEQTPVKIVPELLRWVVLAAVIRRKERAISPELPSHNDAVYTRQNADTWADTGGEDKRAARAWAETACNGAESPQAKTLCGRHSRPRHSKSLPQESKAGTAGIESLYKR